jgi:fatty-acyl-CoA synthase
MAPLIGAFEAWSYGSQGIVMTIRNPGDIEALEAQSLLAHRLPRTSYEALAATAARTPDAKALSFFLLADAYEEAFVWTYTELLADVTRAANAFHSLDVTAENPVAFVLPNLPETHFVIWGGETAGAVLAINPTFEPAQIANLMKTARARVLVTLRPNPVVDLWSKLAPCLDALPDLKTVALVDAMLYAGAGAGRRDVSAHTFAGVDVVDFRDCLLAQPADRLLAPQAVSTDAVCSYFCTGGTTGAPKIAVRTHRNEIFDAWSAAQMVETRQSPRATLCGLPLFHVNAQLVMGLQAWMRGDHVVLATPEGYRGKNVIARFWEIVAHYRVTIFSGVPTIFSALMSAPIAGADISSLEFAICGAAPMPAKLIADFEAKTGLKILEGYGLTEGGCVSSVNPAAGERRAGSIGLRIPYQGMMAAILDEAGCFVRKADTNEIGAILIHGPNVFCGYLDARHNAGIWVDVDGVAWLNTGDLGRQDADGYFWLTGRRKELIIRGGHNIDPKMIEDAFQGHPAVALVAAIGSPDAYAGEVPVVYVQMKPGASASEQELLDFAAGRIPERAAVPKHVRVVPALPLTNVGKIFKPALQGREAEIVIRSEADAAGAAIVSIEVEQDPRVGQSFRIRVASGAGSLHQALERYAFKFAVLQ